MEVKYGFSKMNCGENMRRMVSYYQAGYKRYGRSVEALGWLKGKQNLRFRNLSRHIDKQDFTVLDFGCGLGDLYVFLKKRYKQFRYLGVDLVGEFISDNNVFFQSEDALFKKIECYTDIVEDFDYVILSGVFNFLYDQSMLVHQATVFEIIEHLYNKSSVAFSTDFLSPYVDYKQQNAYHQDISSLLKHLPQKYKCFELNHSYMPFEFSITIYKET